MAKEDKSFVSYTLGIVSIVMAFFQPLAGFVFGVIGFAQSKGQKTETGKKAKKYSIIGMVLSIIWLIISIVVAIYITKTIGLSNFPLA